MAFHMVCDEDYLQRYPMSSAELKEWFERYCEWCWGKGFGDCDKCRKHYKHLRYLAKMKEFKELNNAKK